MYGSIVLRIRIRPLTGKNRSESDLKESIDFTAIILLELIDLDTTLLNPDPDQTGPDFFLSF